ncbi:hypothetical protein ACJX0J_013169, partial [Zea mays]
NINIISKINVPLPSTLLQIIRFQIQMTYFLNNIDSFSCTIFFVLLEWGLAAVNYANA